MSSHFFISNGSLTTRYDLQDNLRLRMRIVYTRRQTVGDICIAFESNVSLIHHRGPRGRAVSVLAHHLHADNDTVEEA